MVQGASYVCFLIIIHKGAQYCCSCVSRKGGWYACYLILHFYQDGHVGWWSIWQYKGIDIKEWSCIHATKVQWIVSTVSGGGVTSAARILMVAFMLAKEIQCMVHLKGTIVIMRTAHIRVHLRRICIAILWHSWKHFKNNGTVSGLSRIGLVSIIFLFSLSFQRRVCIHKAFHLNINTCLITSFSPAAHLSHDQLVHGSIPYYLAHCH